MKIPEKQNARNTTAEIDMLRLQRKPVFDKQCRAAGTLGFVKPAPMLWGVGLLSSSLQEGTVTCSRQQSQAALKYFLQ